MKEIIKTSKGRFVVIDDKKETYYPFHMYIQLYGDNYYKLSEITEEQASEIVDNSMMNTLCYDNYINEGFKGRTWFNSAIQSLHSLLESQGIEITNNTYIFKL